METNSIRTASLIMTNERAVAKKVPVATWIGLVLSLFAMVLIRYAFVFLVPEMTFASEILKETLIWVSAVVLLVIIRRGERLPMRSIGLGTARRRTGLSDRVRSRSRIRRIRKTAALVNYAHRFPGRSGGRVILSRLRHRTVGDDRPRTLLVGHDSAGHFFTWPLVGRRCKYSNRACSGYNLNGILFMAS